MRRILLFLCLLTGQVHAQNTFGLSEYVTVSVNPANHKAYASGGNADFFGTNQAGMQALPNLILQETGGAIPDAWDAWGGLHDACFTAGVNHELYFVGAPAGSVRGDGKAVNSFTLEGTNYYYATKITTDSAGNAFNNVQWAQQVWSNNRSIGWYIQKFDGTLWFHGTDSAQGYRLNGTTGVRKTRPVQIALPGGRLVKNFSCSYSVIICCTDGTVWTGAGGTCDPWAIPLGYNCSGGSGDTESWKSLHQLKDQNGVNITNAQWVAGGRFQNFIIMGATLDSVIGYGPRGALGINSIDFTPTGTPIRLDTFWKFVPRKIMCSSQMTYCILKDSTARTFGNSPMGEAGDGTHLNRDIFGYGYDYNTPLWVSAPVNPIPSRHDIMNVYTSMTYCFWVIWEFANGEWAGNGRNKAAALINGEMASDGIAGQMAAQYDMAWDIMNTTYMNLFQLRYLIYIAPKPCIDNGSATGCNGYSAPPNLPPTISFANQTTTSSSITLHCTASPQSGRVLSRYDIELVDGNIEIKFSTHCDSVFTLTGLTVGIHHIKATVTDYLNSKNSATMTLTVNSAGGAVTTTTSLKKKRGVKRKWRS